MWNKIILNEFDYLKFGNPCIYDTHFGETNSTAPFRVKMSTTCVREPIQLLRETFMYIYIVWKQLGN